MGSTGAIVRCSCGLKIGSMVRLMLAQAEDNQPLVDAEAMQVVAKIGVMKRHWDLGHTLTGRAFEYEIRGAAEALKKHEDAQGFASRFSRAAKIIVATLCKR